MSTTDHPIVVCLKWVTHPGEPHDERFAGISPADQSALEFALQQGATMGVGVTAVTVGPAVVVSVLRDAISCGAAQAIHVLAHPAMRSDEVADAIAAAVGAPRWVWCGDYSLDRGTGSVPAFLAARLGAQQALGIIHLEPAGDGTIAATRRLDGGRREMLQVHAPAVVSVEGATAHLRRAGLAAVRAALQAPITIVQSSSALHGPDAVVQSYRPRARALAAPAGSPLDRLRVLTDAGAASAARGETVVLEPEAAAARIVEALRQWGYLDE